MTSAPIPTRKEARRARLEGLIANRPRVGPQTVHFDLANACNTRCTTCWHHSPHLLPQHRPTAAWKRETLPLGSFVAALDDLVTLGGLEGVILSGMGDPTLNDDLYAMVAHARQAGLHVTIITNGLRLDVARLAAAIDGPMHDHLDILLSVCGVTRDAWQRFHAHPRPDGFETMLTRLGELGAHTFRPKQVQVINDANAHQLVAMVEFAHAHNAKAISFKLASLANGTEAVAIPEAQMCRMRDEDVPAAIARATALGVDTDLLAFQRQLHPGSARTAPIEDIGCFMGFLYARVSVLGEVLFCCNTQVQVGDLRTGARLADLWTSDAWQARRDEVRQGRYFAGCDQCGKLKQNIKWSDKLRDALGEERFLPLIGRGPT